MSDTPISDMQELRHILAELATDIARTNATLEAIREKTDENHATLRGNNGSDGVIARLVGVERTLQYVDVSLRGSGNEAGLVVRMSRIEDTVDRLSKTMDKIREVPGKLIKLETYQIQFPSLVWLARYRTKEILIITTVVVVVAALLVTTNEQTLLAKILENLIFKLSGL